MSHTMKNILRKKYKKTKFYWGFRPDKGLIDVAKSVPKGIALDIGAGEGRNSIFLARRGFKVEAIDRIAEGLKKCKKYAQKHNLPIRTKVIDLRKFKFLAQKYSLVLSINAIDFLRLPEIKKILAEIKKSLKKEGVFYLIVFSTRDPSFRRLKDRGIKMVEKNTFYFPRNKIVRHYFQKTELIRLLKGFKILKIEEIYKKIIPSTVHFHNIIRAIVKK